jgi:cation-transporting ATPase 13A1
MPVSTVPLTPKPTWARWDLLPFTLFQVSLYFWFSVSPTQHNYGALYLVLALPALIVQTITHLTIHWSANARAKIGFSKTTLTEAAYVLVNKTNYLSSIEALSDNAFTYCNQRYVFDSERKAFVKPEFPVNNPFGLYLNSKGLTTLQAKQAQDKWGRNELQIPIPAFLELMKEHVVAPFFVFQLFCVGLWMLDEYWYISLYTLAMLLFFESTVVFQRQSYCKRIRSVKPPPQQLQVYRDKAWRPLPQEKLVPGDLVTLDASTKVVPCDLLLLAGGCVLDESLLTGEAVPQAKQDVSTRNADEELNMQHDRVHLLQGGTEILRVFPGQANQGAVCVVLRSGWYTTKGKLVRTMLFDSKRVTAGSKEAFVFIAILLMFAVIASSYFLKNALEDPNRDNFKVLLKCIMILTSVVPPELPFVLAMAINSSIAALQAKQIFCTEPFRLPLAGKATVVCFDKTGTLTEQDFQLKGVTLPNANLKEATALRLPTASDDTAAVLAGCHSLTLYNGEVIGDPVEKLALADLKWRLEDGKVSGNYGEKLEILRAFPFTSDLRRMTTIARVTLRNKPQSLRVLVKGAPEVVLGLLSREPQHYEAIKTHYTSEGLRVLALAWRPLTDAEASNFERIARKDLETGLEWAGMLVLKSPLKSDSKAVVMEIRKSSHRSVIITGDNVHTSASVAQDLGLGTVPVFVTRDNAKEVRDSSTPGAILCIEGQDLDFVISSGLFPRVDVFARMTPAQKEQVLAKYNATQFTVMCGDGTNDVGALKRAHVGLALLSKPVVKADTARMTTEQVEFGDASIAAPFTSKGTSVMAVKELIQQGRCALVTTYMMYRILALNCLLSAYSLSALYLDGIRMGDTQMTISALFITVLFFMLSRAKPMTKLSRFHPPTSVFERHILVSVVIQFAVHLSGLIYLTSLAKSYMPRETIKYTFDDPFQPDVLNSTIFLYTSWVSGVIFLVNYQGRPFMQALSKNSFMANTFKVYLGGLLAAVMRFAEIDTVLQLAPFPDETYQLKIMCVFLGNLGACYCVEEVIKRRKYPQATKSRKS